MAASAWGDNGVMRPVNYEVLFEVEDAHWWFVGRRAIVFALLEEATEMSDKLQFVVASSRDKLKFVEPSSNSAAEMSDKFQFVAAASHDKLRFAGHLPNSMLDIGCGTGATMDHLQRYGAVHGVDLSEIPLSFSRRRGHERVLCASATELPFAAASFDLVTALDVIEHLDDDLAGLREIRRVLKPGAPAVIFVPAFQSLWGPNDDQSGHKRRYRLPQLRAAVEAAGLRVERISYANIAMFAPIWLGRKLLNLLGRTEQSENRINHPWLNRLIARVFAGEAHWLRHRSLPFGVSIICVARKAE